MVDLATYRSRIGVFISCHASYLRGVQRICSHNRRYSMMSTWTYPVIFMAFLGLVMLCISEDPAIEKNPGPSQKVGKVVIDFLSQEEMDIFNNLKTGNTDIAETASHRHFLKYCLNMDVLPRGYERKLPMCVRKSNKELEEKLCNIDENSTKERITVTANHYSVILIGLISDRSEYFNALKGICTPDRYEYLMSILQDLHDKEVRQNQKRKDKKLHSLISVNATKLTKYWIPELKLTTTEHNFIVNNEEISDESIDAALILLGEQAPYLFLQPCTFTVDNLVYSPLETIHIHHNGHHHYATSSSIGRNVKVYDSLNCEPTASLIDQISAIYSPVKGVLPTINKVLMRHVQEGSKDCGIFSIAYAVELTFGSDPSLQVFDQSQMRKHLVSCFENRFISPFPKAKCYNTPSREIDITKDTDSTGKWSKPATLTSKVSPDRNRIDFCTTNKFSPLASSQDLNHNNTKSPNKQSNKKRESPCKKRQHVPKSTTKTQIPTKDSPQHHTNATKPRKLFSKEGYVLNISNRQLSPDEKTVLELGLSFSPSQKAYNKETLAIDLYKFIRKLKLREYFHERKGDKATETSRIEDDDRCASKWQYRNADWYPDEVRNNRSPALKDFISNIEKDIGLSLGKREKLFWDNLAPSLRKALQSLARDEDIVIKPADKGGSIVIMNKGDYEQACLNLLEDTDFYEEVLTDPNPVYKESFMQAAEDLYNQNLITSFERKMLEKGVRTPMFYGLPKIHSDYTDFPPLRPICSGYDSCSVRFSELIDTFLKAAAKKTDSYVQDSTDFINKTKDHIFKPSDEQSVYIGVMDVNSLYPNIDQNEGAEACSYYLNGRKNKLFPTALIHKFILMVLKSNTLSFGSKLFHQIKGTAMGTPMAVNFANLFMSNFETNMLNDFEEQYGTRPKLYLRYIDDIFFVWVGNKADLDTFINFCNSYSEKKQMASKITFKSRYSSNFVEFLDMTVRLENNRITTDLFCKPTAKHQYLHRSSFHSPTTIRSLPKTQLIRLRRICSHIKDYDRHSLDFVNFFTRRGYKKSPIMKSREEVRNTSRESLLVYNVKGKNGNQRVVLALNWHPKYQDFGKILHDCHDNMVKKTPNMLQILPAPPMVAYRRNRTFNDILTRTKFTNFTSHTYQDNSKTTIKHLMNNSGTILNEKTGNSCKIEGGISTEKNTIYAVKCTLHNLIYVGQTSYQLNERMNQHRSDSILHPEKCSLARHFYENECTFDKNSNISILEKNVFGSLQHREFREDVWITRLNTVPPNGLNNDVHSFATTYYNVFR